MFGNRLTYIYKFLNKSSSWFPMLKKTVSSQTDYDFDLKFGDLSLKEYVNQLQNKFTSKNNDLTSFEESNLRIVINLLSERKNIISDILNLADMLQDKDKEIKTLAENEKVELEQKVELIDKNVVKSLLDMHSEPQCNSIVLEVNAGVGGQEAMLFANELFNMYMNFSESKKWTFEITDYSTSDLEGCRHASAMIDGSFVYNYLIHEAGVHRVQRIPVTEKSGRVHTSTASVLVLPQPTEIQVQLNNSDLKIETKRATGAGGQHVNTTDSAVRITHIPTGISTECQIDRSQIKNKKIALQKLRTLIYNQQVEKQNYELEKTKKTQVRSNFRNERIRTYNFSQDRITDHRLQGYNVYNVREFLSGHEKLESLIRKLDENCKTQRLLEAIQKFKVR